MYRVGSKIPSPLIRLASVLKGTGKKPCVSNQVVSLFQSPSAFAGKRCFTSAAPCRAPPSKETPLTSTSHPKLQRDARYAQLEESDVKYFRGFLEENQIIHNAPEDLAAYNTDWIGKYRGQSSLVLKPRNTEQVSRILKHCHARRLAVVPQGGNTGLVGGSVPVFDEIVLSTCNLNQVRSFDAVSGIVVAEAGCILESLNNYLSPHGFMMPLDLGAKGSCHIGGNLAANAGGLRLLRYGSLHGSTLGLEVVLPDGTILNNLATLRKDNTGYDLKQLFIGSEGSLGIITAAAILTPQLPKAVNVAFLGVNSYEAVQTVFTKARQQLSEILSAFEFIDDESMKLVKHHAALRDPLSDSFPFYVLIETHGSNKDHDDEKLSALLEKLMEEEIVQDGVVAQDETQVASLWKYREFVPEAVSKHGKAYKYDLSVPLPSLYQVVEKVRAHLETQGVLDPNSESGLIKVVTGYGHIGDGNLHLNVIASEVSPRVAAALEPYVYELTSSYQGSISAEHGLGLQKAEYLKYSKSPEMIKLMHITKKQYDPQGILNPYKYLPTIRSE